MVRSKILRKHQDWKNVIDLKLKHIDTLLSFSQQTFYAILAFLGAVFLGILALSPYLGKYIYWWGLTIIFVLYALGLVGLLYFYIRNFRNNVDDYYNKLLYEVMIGKIKDIKPISNEEYRDMFKD